jgi:carboxypeptidase C (cathepsin A)
VGNASQQRGHLHYWLIESERSTQKTDPLVLWYNGGPGSSSLIGLLTENGQLQLNDNSLNVSKGSAPTLFYNPNSWSQVANVLYLEQPKGVGFSYCDDTTKRCVNTDESTAIDGHEFLVNFFHAFPEYKQNDFYITGESYAGLYIPMLMDQIDSHNDIPNFKGSMIGNGCWGSDCFYGMTEPEIDYHIFEGHGLISYPLKLSIDEACTDFQNPSSQCEKLLGESNRLASDFNVYNIYDLCNGDSSRADPDALAGALVDANATTRHEAIRSVLRRKTVNVKTRQESLSPHPALTGALNDFICGGQNAMDVWLDLKDVQKALHVDAHADNSMHYEKTAGDITNTYKKLMTKYQLLIYSGDVDACVPYWGTEKFTRSIGGTVKKSWHAWRSNSIENKGEVVAGYAVAYDDFQFVTVKGAGHMVPTFRPVFALNLLKKFLAGVEF